MSPLKVVILGGGISGLTAAWYLEKSEASLSVTVIEKELIPGGWIATRQEGEFFFERGPRTLRVHPSSRSAWELIADLGLAGDVIGEGDCAQDRYLWDGKMLQKAPNSLWKLFTSPLTRDLLKTGVAEWLRPKGSDEDESIHRFISRRYSPEVAERLFDPLMSGIYAGDIRKLSARMCLPTLWEWEQRHGGILKGMLREDRDKRPLPFADKLQGHTLFTLKSGLAALPQALAKGLSDVRLGATAVSLIPLKSGMRVTLANGTILDADHVISTLPAHALAPLLSTATPELEQKLNVFDKASLVAVHIGWHHPVLKHEGFGYLVASRHREDILGTVFDSSIFPQQNGHPDETRLTVMFGGRHRPDLVDKTPEESLEIALRSLHRHLGISKEPAAYSTTYAYNAIPQYNVGHCDAVLALRRAAAQAWPALTILGTSFDGVAVTGCISHAKDAANKLHGEQEELLKRT